MIKMVDLVRYLMECGFELRVPSCPEELFLRDVTQDSRKVEQGALFCCVTGCRADGHDYAEEAVAKGAAALLCERPLDIPLPQIIVGDVRRAMGHAASAVHGFPCEKLQLLAVTGTNGKSTSAYLIRHLLAEAGRRSGLIGTIVYSDGRCDVEADRTTPENCDIHRWLARMVEAGCDSCVMETSSHGLEQGRLAGCLFDRALFTNLTPEHLDYHGDMENYFASKSRLFSEYMKPGWKGAVNVDDPYGARLHDRWPDQLMPFSLKADVERGLRVERRRMDISGLTLDIRFPDGRSVEGLHVPLMGNFNVYNTAGALALVETLSLKESDLKVAMRRIPQVPGRMERYCFRNGSCAVVDYAHSPDALENVLTALREVTEGRIFAVFGLGGERYVENRPAMGAIAASLADFVLITSDNPRSENPREIARQIAVGIEGISRSVPYAIEIDRKKAVFQALSMAHAGDVVLIGGKGPERFILFSDHKEPYNDTETVLEWARLNGEVGELPLR
ncbi:UDP-N-acetylmuramoyl-L-alanyl-D-glutamate--2,6-diaminopimelate ligase [Aminithiophilus ramosus]|uniref:UDP-N-acetylmuramoyl-L-alanyl-D-glutamate--2,6-diaminopimelate ligase n=3 Tax=Synergistia TaxID=649775 RepID=A0A9Q7AQF5_9BACT|nr:UDP-N-acetylmuramoyl-L-alanyl-D-glutamate--2,6-diaminopimelate ligase [Aminithiophilus ramosus]QVL37387.1 UDP-N-acetylmuramoyl-L-alanyl-D-glutamate--2,6-diaminopimelate ligase [Synergistota bacterium]